MTMIPVIYINILTGERFQIAGVGNVLRYATS